ncbi:MAG: hypothetical protein RJQ00_07295 [Vicingaceae bacterium]
MEKLDFASIQRGASIIEENANKQHEFYDLNESSINLNSDTEDLEIEGNEFEEKNELTEIKLFDHSKSVDENFEDGSSKKYILFEVRNDGEVEVPDIEDALPRPESKCLVNLFSIEDYGSSLEFMPITYSSFMGVECKNFFRYNSDFFSCDERVFFIFLLVKFNYFKHKPFYWSKEVIYRETGIKKDRANKIVDKFCKLGIIKTEVKKSTLNGRPQQITYFDIDGQKIVDLLPQIIVNYEEDQYDLVHDIEKYLKPGIKE